MDTLTHLYTRFHQICLISDFRNESINHTLFICRPIYSTAFNITNLKKKREKKKMKLCGHQSDIEYLFTGVTIFEYRSMSAYITETRHPPTPKALSHRCDAITRCGNAINEKKLIYINTSALRKAECSNVFRGTWQMLMQ